MTDIVFEASGVLYDKLSRTQRPVYMRMKGHAVDISPPDAGGPPGIWPGPGDPDYPGKPPGGGGGEPPLGIWGPTDPRPGYGLPGNQPGVWPNPPEGTAPIPGHPIVLPPEQTPPGMKPSEPPAPGSPTTVVPGEYPVNPVTPPVYLTVNWPGIGPVTVAQPLTAQPKPQ